MRVLVFSRDVPGLDPRSATAERWRGLRDFGVELDFLVASDSATRWAEEGLMVTGSGGANPLSRLWKLLKLAKKHIGAAQLITAQDPFELGFIAWWVARRSGKPFEIQDHGGFFDGEAAKEPLWVLRSRLARYLARRADRIRTVSPKSFERLQSDWIGEKTYLLPIAAQQKFFSIERIPDPDLVVTVGRLVSVKRMDMVLKSFRELRFLRPTARLVIVGDGPENVSLHALAERLNISACVEFVGAADPAPWLARASLFVLLSSHEGWGVAAVEAALIGVPVVMSDTGCASWLEQRGRATVVRTSNPKEISEVFSAHMGLFHPSAIEGVDRPMETANKQVEAWKEVVFDKPRTLMCVQSVDEKDPLFGFFVGWLRAFSEYGKAMVYALRVPDALSSFSRGIEIYPSRPKTSRSRLRVLWTIARASWNERFRYRSVFIRGDAVYVACLGWLWRLLGKRIVFWYAHYTVRSIWFWLAVPWAQVVVTSVPEANPLSSAISIGQSIDEEKFSPTGRVPSAELRFLIFGRVSSVKRVPWMIEQMAAVLPSLQRLRVVGRALDDEERARVRSALEGSEAIWEDRDVVSAEAPGLYHSVDCVLNATPGSLDKTIVEAALSGAIVLATTPAYGHSLPAHLRWLCAESSKMFQVALRRIISLTPEERNSIARDLRSWAIQNHSLRHQLAKLALLLAPKNSHSAKP